jgi:hypothetical protein
MQQPPADRPHRDKRRRPMPAAPVAQAPTANSHSHHAGPYQPPQMGRVPSQPEGGQPQLYPASGSAGMPPHSRDSGAHYEYMPQHQAPGPIPASPYGAAAAARPPNGEVAAVDLGRQEERNGDSRPISSSAEHTSAENARGATESTFTAVN